MIAFIALLSKVQIMCDFVRFVGRGCEFDFHVKLTPTFLLNAERRLFQDCLYLDCIVSISRMVSNQITACLDLRLRQCVSLSQATHSESQESDHTLSGTSTKTRVQMESDLVESICSNQRAILVHEPDFDVPRSLRETFNLGWLVSVFEKFHVSQLLGVASCTLCRWKGRKCESVDVGVAPPCWCAWSYPRPTGGTLAISMREAHCRKEQRIRLFRSAGRQGKGRQGKVEMLVETSHVHDPLLGDEADSSLDL